LREVDDKRDIDLRRGKRETYMQESEERKRKEERHREGMKF